MYKLEIKLKQHTPLIHFQHDQEGATLRASEVKPKLDRFIVNHLGENEIVKSWLNETEKKALREEIALNYKLVIKGNERLSDITLHVETGTKWDNKDKKYKTVYKTSLTESNKRDFPFLLANMGGKENKKELMNLVMHTSLDLKIICKNPELAKFIKSNIAKFFALSHFGQRSSKGFGSFSVISIGDDSEKWDSSSYFPDKTPFLSFSLEGTSGVKEEQVRLFDVIDYYWKSLKSGINYTKRAEGGPQDEIIRVNGERYIKSFLWTYLNEKSNSPKNWEKKEIKTFFNLISPDQQRSDITSNPPVFARALLGCPDKFEYRVPQCIFEKNSRGNLIEKKFQYQVSISNNSGIARIPAPIYFKPYVEGKQVKVYILIDPTIKIELASLGDLIPYTFECQEEELNINLDINAINHVELLTQYHKFLGFKFIPKNSQWKNILNKECVTIETI